LATAVRPVIGVISLPAYVVGTATIGSPWLSASALARPVDEPPPRQTATSAPASVAAARARSASSTGTCCTTSSQRRTIRSPSCSATASPRAFAAPSAIRKTRARSSASTSARTSVTRPGPKTTRPGSDS
jgi:hypothetical protein